RAPRTRTRPWPPASPRSASAWRAASRCTRCTSGSTGRRWRRGPHSSGRCCVLSSETKSFAADLAEARATWRADAGELEPAQTDSGIPVEGVYTPAEDSEYLDKLGMPGAFPFTRGIYPSMYRGRPWTVRLYSGWGTPEDTNERFRYLLDRGQTGLSVALDLPTQMGFDSDDPIAQHEVGKVGVAVASLADMETIFDGIPLD